MRSLCRSMRNVKRRILLNIDGGFTTRRAIRFLFVLTAGRRATKESIFLAQSQWQIQKSNIGSAMCAIKIMMQSREQIF